MTKNEFIEKFEEVIEAEQGYIKGDEALSDLAGWDSIAVMTFIAMVDENIGVTLSAADIAKSKSIKDLMALLGDRITE